LYPAPRGPLSKAALLRSTSATQTWPLTATRGRLIGSYGPTWSFPLLHNGCFRPCRVGQRKVKESPCDSRFKHDLVRPILTPHKHVLTCANRTDLVIHDPHRPDGLAHLIRVPLILTTNASMAPRGLELEVNSKSISSHCSCTAFSVASNARSWRCLEPSPSRSKSDGEGPSRLFQLGVSLRRLQPSTGARQGAALRASARRPSRWLKCCAAVQDVDPSVRMRVQGFGGKFDVRGAGS
jgi:hypothetical protein